MLAIPGHARHADRGWLFELDELVGEGYIGHADGGHFELCDLDLARHTICRCGEDMDFRGFELRGPSGERVAYRPYAFCLACWWWIEF